MPGLAVFLTVLAINFVGEALNEALNPRSALKALR
jgi:ABC-type dipeptide/oligopeptide/nickel transport system permease subunit